MKSTDKNVVGARGVPQPIKPRPGPAHQLKPEIAQMKKVGLAHDFKRPVAPPVYRPQPVPKVLQRKSAVVRQSPSPVSRSQTAAPPANLLQARKLAQAKMAAAQPRTPAAPQVYRPQPPPRVLQTKGSHRPVTAAPTSNAAMPPARQMFPRDHQRITQRPPLVPARPNSAATKTRPRS